MQIGACALRSSAATISLRLRPRPPLPGAALHDTTTRPSGNAASCARSARSRGLSPSAAFVRSPSSPSGDVVIAPQGHEVAIEILAECDDLALEAATHLAHQLLVCRARLAVEDAPSQSFHAVPAQTLRCDRPARRP